ncbi:hypothetical protein [Pantoea sp. DY-5]|uniref:hypothetical protein n=1 Tax=Pantoea sp. DY-5 TaxID=2871488 RepID=UPI001C953416|nr:hypothetical protein [Pantoea sp. DY-5]MBY4837893.1 hypothetical protein [Pantoea sp. DY-5]
MKNTRSTMHNSMAGSSYYIAESAKMQPHAWHPPFIGVPVQPIIEKILSEEPLRMEEIPLEGGSSSSGNLILTGRGQPGSTLFIFDGDKFLDGVFVNSVGEWSYNLHAFGPGHHQLKVIDEISKESSISVIIDVRNPAADTPVTLSYATDYTNNDLVMLKDGDTISNSSPRFTGLAKKFANVYIFDNGELIGSVKANKMGQWWFKADLKEGDHNFGFGYSADTISASFNLHIVCENEVTPLPEPIFEKIPDLGLVPLPKPIHEQNPDYGLVPLPKPIHEQNPDYGLVPLPKPIHEQIPDYGLVPLPKPIHEQIPDYGLVPLPKPIHEQIPDFGLVPLPKPIHEQIPDYGLVPLPKPIHEQIPDFGLVPLPKPIHEQIPDYGLVPLPKPIHEQNPDYGLVPLPKPIHEQIPDYGLVPLPKPIHEQIPDFGLVPLPKPIRDESRDLTPLPEPIPNPAISPVAPTLEHIQESWGNITNLDIHQGATVHDPYLRLSGEATPFTVVEIYDNGKLMTTAVVTDIGKWFIHDLKFGNGEHALTVKSSDGTSESFNFVVDHKSVGISAVSDAYFDLDHYETNGGNIIGNDLIILGFGTPNTQVEVLDERGRSLGHAGINESGRWYLKAQKSLADGEHVLTVRSSDKHTDTFNITIGEPLTIQDEPSMYTIDSLELSATDLLSNTQPALLNNEAEDLPAIASLEHSELIHNVSSMGGVMAFVAQDKPEELQTFIY